MYVCIGKLSCKMYEMINESRNGWDGDREQKFKLF